MPERGSKTSTVPVVWATFGIFSARSKLFPVALVTTDETWLYHNEPETKQQSLEWRHSGSLSPKEFREQNSAGKVLTRFFGIKNVTSSLIIFHRAKLSTRSITHLWWCNWETIWRKNAAESSPRGSCIWTTMPRAHRALATQKTLAYMGFQCLDHPPYSPNLAPSDYHLFPELKKTTEKSPFFVRRGGHCCHGDPVGRTTLWIFLSGLQKVEQRATSCIELCEQYVG